MKNWTERKVYAMAQVSRDYIRKELFEDIKATKRILKDTTLCRQATAQEVARMDGMLMMALMCEMITVEEKKELSAELHNLHNQ